MGPGLLEFVYEEFLAHYLARDNLKFERQVMLAIERDGLHVEAAYRIDLLVEDAVVVELKAVSRLEPVHHAQLLTYLRLSGKSVGLLFNFNVDCLRDGIVRRVL